MFLEFPSTHSHTYLAFPKSSDIFTNHEIKFSKRVKSFLPSHKTRRLFWPDFPKFNFFINQANANEDLFDFVFSSPFFSYSTCLPSCEIS